MWVKSGHNGRCVVSAAAHFDLKRGDAQNKYSLPTCRSDSPTVGLAGLVSNCADCVDRDPLAGASVRAWGETRVLGTRDGLSSPFMPLTRTASHGIGPAEGSWGTAISPPWG